MQNLPEPPDPQFLALQQAVSGQYSLQRELGRGGSGIVYLAHDVRLDRPVALKLLLPGLAEQPDLRKQFLREARTAAQLSHPHIVPVHAVDEVDGFVFIVMAYVPEKTVGERIRQGGPFPPTEAARILRDVAWSLAYAHAQGVVHRDVKPDNILLEEGTGRALVTDFGIAQVGRRLRQDRTTDLQGTVEFMSPEQVQGGPVDGRSDLYSLGIVGYYMLSGQVPFQGETKAETLSMHLAESAPPVATVAPALPFVLTQVVDRCLEKDPNSRFPDGEDLAAALEPAQDARKKAPPAIHLFIEEMRGQGVAIAVSIVLGFLFFSMVAGGLLSGVDSDGVLVLALFAVLGAGVTVGPAAVVTFQARRLLRTGHDRDEVIRALERQIRDMRDAVASLPRPAPQLLDQWLRWTTLIGFVGSVGMYVWHIIGIDTLNANFWGLYDAVMNVFATLFYGGGFFLIVRSRRKGPQRIRGKRWVQFWKSTLGGWIFRLARVGLDYRPAEAPVFRPTEVAIGMAADRLFQELPKHLKRSFKELPSVLSSLEADAERTRTHIRELEESLGKLGERKRQTGEEHRQVLERLLKARRAAEAKLTEIVKALETLRLGLLKMHAGEANLDGMTEDLSAARTLALNMVHFAEGAEEVAQLLSFSERRGESKATTPA